MRGLALLCLVGFILTVALYQGGTSPTPKTKRSPLSRRPFEGTNGTNSSLFKVNDFTAVIKDLILTTGQRRTNVQWNGTIRAIDSDFGFPPVVSKEDTKVVHHNISVGATVKEDAPERP